MNEHEFQDLNMCSPFVCAFAYVLYSFAVKYSNVNIVNCGIDIKLCEMTATQQLAIINLRWQHVLCQHE